MSRKSHTLDLHPVYNQGNKIDTALENALADAEKAKARELEIICAKGSGQIKKRVLRFLDRKDIRQRYQRIKKDPGNYSREFVSFKWK